MGLLIDSTLVEVLCTVLFILWLIYASVTEKYSYWREKGVPQINPVFPFGTFKEIILGKLHVGEFYDKCYKQFSSERYFGVYDMNKPIFVVRDPELIKHIMTKDFNYFTDRYTLSFNAKKDYINKHLINMKGKEWKEMRLKLTPTFTSAKMKEMLTLIDKCSQQLEDHVNKLVSIEPVVDAKDVLSRFTMDVIASTAFGLDINSLAKKDECEFYKYVMKVFNFNKLMIFVRIMYSTFPVLSRMFPMSYFPPEDVTDFLTNIVHNTVNYREQHNITRNDFLQLLINLRDNKAFGENKTTDGNEKTGFTIEEITAQCFIFFLVGFHTSSSLMTFFLYELACDPHLQQKVYDEIRETLTKHEGHLSYQAVQEMTFMDKVISETLRYYSLLSVLSRVCTEPYQVPGSDLVLEKGQVVIIPTFAIHHDPEFYSQPYTFDPERFTPEKVKERRPYTYLPFGEGPRMCLGMNFGLLQAKIGLASIVSNFEFQVAPDTPVPLTFNKRQFVIEPEKPIMLHMTKRKPVY